MYRDIKAMGIIDMLSTVLGGEIVEGPGSSIKRRPEEKVHGTVTSKIARLLYTADLAMVNYIVNLDEQHRRDHVAGQISETHDCEAVKGEIKQLQLRREILSRVLRQSVIEEHPVVATNAVGIRDGWTFVGQGEEWNDNVVNDARLFMTRNFISRITSIVRSKRVSIAEDDLEPVRIGEEVIGCINDERVQTLWTFIDEVMDEYRSNVPEGVISGDPEVVGEMTVNQVNRIKKTASHYVSLIELAKSIFWCAVQDEIPAASDSPSIRIRRAWEVVKLPRDGDGVEISMTPDGLAIAIPISEDLMKAIIGRLGRQ